MLPIKGPTLLLDEDRCRANISRIVEKAQQNNVEFRPHFKTHQSHAVGRWYREAGVHKITVSSFQMANYFATDGWEDITVAFPVNILEIDLINQLARQIKALNLVVESVETAHFLQAQLTTPVNIFIKIDVGTNRTGILWDHVEKVNALVQVLNNSSKLQFKGFLAHAGHTYGKMAGSVIQDIYDTTMTRLSSIKERHPSAIISVGDTPSFASLSRFSEVDEIRPGNLVFFDLMQWQNNICFSSQIAVAMACPVVSIHPERNELVIYGGGVHFSKDRIHYKEQDCYGIAVEQHSKGWGDILPDVFIRKLSQEHGIVKAPTSFIQKTKIGDLLYFLPVHSCHTVDKMDVYHTLDGLVIEKFSYASR